MFSDCCPFLLVQYNANTTDFYEKWTTYYPFLFTSYELQHEEVNGKVQYINNLAWPEGSGYGYATIAIEYTECGYWQINLEGG